MEEKKKRARNPTPLRGPGYEEAPNVAEGEGWREQRKKEREREGGGDIGSGWLYRITEARRTAWFEGWRTPEGPSVGSGDLLPLFPCLPGLSSFPTLPPPRCTSSLPRRHRGARSLVHRFHADTRRHTQLPLAVSCSTAGPDRPVHSRSSARAVVSTLCVTRRGTVLRAYDLCACVRACMCTCVLLFLIVRRR